MLELGGVSSRQFILIARAHTIVEHIAQHLNILEFGREASSHHIVTARHALDAVAQQIRMWHIRRQKYSLAFTQR